MASWRGTSEEEMPGTLQYSVEEAEMEVIQLPGLVMDSEDSGPLQDFRVRDPVLPSQLRQAAKMEVIQLPGLVRVDCPGLHSIKVCRQDDGLVYLQFGVQVKAW
ncbi:unnamed protein product [Schistocephalus solidus]|uniref:Spindlin interactor and repressor of chromatin-binding protein n=1 Tax=Schistocephalus solidus TaxID=70667 RepID=A0A183TDC5_SCHSO|nr:unnamed protein product [Schistocephalus solidus]